jgi:DNA-binding NarL/FixJ family response regulator
MYTTTPALVYSHHVSDTSIERRLVDAQAAVVEAQKATTQRQEAVTAALAAGWSKYKIAATLGVKESTVRSIITAVQKNAAKENSDA